LSFIFKKKNLEKPVNEGESRIALNILKDCGYNRGLCQLLVSDFDSGILGSHVDLKRRHKMFGKNRIALPKITGFLDLLATQFEDTNV
jgi:hypothetical protein